MQGLILWLAQGFGVGRIRWMPGTFGSLVGLLWMVILLQTGNLWLYLLGALVALAFSVYICGMAEQILKQTDPGCIVLDEIAAMPLCFLGWLAFISWRDLPWPKLETLLGGWQWLGTLAIFFLFRVFDIVKPWPVNASQRLPAGWGVTMDDALAAVYVVLLTAPVLIFG